MARTVTVPSKRLADKLAKMTGRTESARTSAVDAREDAKEAVAGAMAWQAFTEAAANAAEAAQDSPVMVGRVFAYADDGGQGSLVSQTELVDAQAAASFAAGVKPGVYADIAAKDVDGGEEWIAYVAEDSEQDGFDEDGNPQMRTEPSGAGMELAGGGGPVTVEGVDKRLAELGIQEGMRTDLQLRSAIGLDFAMAEGAPLAECGGEQALKHLKPVVVQARADADGRYPQAFYDVAEAMGRGLVSANELRFVAPGLERAFAEGVEYAPAEEARMFGHVDRLVPGEGIVRDGGPKRTVGEVLRDEGQVPLAGGGIYDSAEAFAEARELG